MLRSITLRLLVLALVAISQASARAELSTALADVQTALDEMHSFVGIGANGQR